MNTALALQIFTLGVKFGLHQSKLGFEPARMLDDDVAPVLRQGFEQYRQEIEAHAKHLTEQKLTGLWYAQHFTAKQAFRFGCQEGFDIWPSIKADKKGVKILTDDVIDNLTQKVFRNTEHPNP